MPYITVGTSSSLAARVMMWVWQLGARFLPIRTVVVASSI